MQIKHKDRFFREKGLRRLFYTDRLTVVATILGAILSILSLAFVSLDFWHEFLNLIRSLFGISKANAAISAEGGPAAYDPRTMINLGIMLSIAIAFFWSLAIMLHSDNEGKVKTASDINKMLLGFLIGSGKTFLGLG